MKFKHIFLFLAENEELWFNDLLYISTIRLFITINTFVLLINLAFKISISNAAIFYASTNCVDDDQEEGVDGTDTDEENRALDGTGGDMHQGYNAHYYGAWNKNLAQWFQFQNWFKCFQSQTNVHFQFD